jgi:hypothetical protein
VNVTAHEEIVVSAPPERVWDFTQDWTRRHEWDPAVVAAEYLERQPPVLRIRGPLLSWSLRRSTLKALRNAKRMIEA